MNKPLKLAGTLLAAALLWGVATGRVYARITGTQPTTADVWCVGPDGAEVCVDSSGNLLPTTDNDTTLGTSSLRWATAYILDITVGDDLTVTDDATVGDDLTVTGDLFKTMASTVTVLSGDTISIAGACGGVLRLTVTTDIATGVVNTWTAPSAANAGCEITVVNVASSSGRITLDDNANFDAGAGYPSAGSIVLGTDDVIRIASLGTKWILISTIIDQ